jgi:hypothetical protein
MNSVLLAVACCLPGTLALAARCRDVPQGGGIGVHCGLDSQTDPPDPALGDTGGCTEASIPNLDLYKRTHACQPGRTMVIYDLTTPFPDNGLPVDHAVAGATSYAIIRATASSPCAHMVDTVDPKPCPDPLLCPDPGSPQPEGAVKVAVRGYIVACWSPPERNGCREVKFHTAATCLHLDHQLLGAGCGAADGVDCSTVSTEQVALAMPGTADRLVCPPDDPASSCRATRPSGVRETFQLLYGGFCVTSNCDNPGVAPVGHPEPGPTCVSQWGQTNLGYNRPAGRGINAPGWYDWKTGSFKVDVTTRMPTCGALGDCLGRISAERTANWDLSLVAVPRPGQQVPCVGGACAAASCTP